MTNNLNKNNLTPFLKEVVDPLQFNFKDFIYDKLPLVPTIFFKGKDKDPIGTKIINNYYTIKFNLEKLENIKKIILSILLTSKCDLEKIKISNNKYKLLKRYLIINFHNTYKETFKKENVKNNVKNNNIETFTQFLIKFISNNYNILQNYNNNYPYFYTIFENEFNNEESKDYFLRLFTKYNDIRSRLLLFLSINVSNAKNQLSDTSYGICSFDFMFDILTNRNMNDNNNNKNNCNNKQYEDYLINVNNKSSSNNDKDTYKVFDRVNIIGKGEGVIVGIDYFGSPKTPFSVQINNEIIKYSLSSLQKIPTTNKIKPTLNSKINLYDSLYYNKNNSDFYKNNHKNNMNNLYKNIITSINQSFDNGSSSLYDVIVNCLNLDFNLIKFIFCYVEPKIYNKAIDSYYSVNEYIYNNINSFDSYYKDYIRWYNKLLGLSILDSNIKINFTEESNFEDFYINLMQKLE